MSQQSQQPDYDQTLKRLLTRAHDAFLALIAPGMRWIGEASPELPAIARQADIVWVVEDADGRRWLLHIELQTEPDADMGERVAEYAIRLWRRDHLPLRTLIVFLRPARIMPESPFIIYDHLGRESLHYNYDVLRLWEIPQERVLDTPFHELWPLAGLMQGVTADTTVAVAERIAAAPVPAAERDELTRILILLTGLRVRWPVLAEALRRRLMLGNLWEESSLKEALAVRERERGMAEAYRIVLDDRFGPLSEDVVTALASSDEDTLRTLGRHITSDSLEQIRARLGLS